MKAAYLCADPGVPVFGAKGCSVHVQELIQAMRQIHVEISLFIMNGDGQRPRAFSGFPVVKLPGVRGEDRKSREIAALAMNTRIPSILKGMGPFDFVYERYSLWSYAAMEWARKQEIPAVLEVNAPLIEEQELYRDLFYKQEAEIATRRAFHSASVILIVSENLRKYLERFSVDPRKVRVMPNGVNPYRFPHGLVPRFAARPEVFTIGFIGSLKPWHGLTHLIDAFEILYRKDSNVRLLLVGDGPERESLTRGLAERNLLEASHFTGMVDPYEIPAVLASFDVAVAPYPHIENLYFSPMKVFEYMAAGLPVVASAIGQINQIIENEVNGLLCPPGDALLLARALERLRQSPQLRTKLGLAARSRVLRDYTWAKNAQEIVNLVNAASTAISADRNSGYGEKRALNSSAVKLRAQRSL